MSDTIEKIATEGNSEKLHKRLILGISGSKIELVNLLSDYYSIPADSNLHQRIFNKKESSEWTFRSLMNLFNDALDEIEVSLVVNSAGLIINYTPVDLISLLLLNMNQLQNLTPENEREVEALIEKAISLCNRFTHFIQIFPGGSNRTINSDLKANLKAGIYHRYYEKIGCCVITVPDLLITVDDQFDFITRVINLLEKF